MKLFKKFKPQVLRVRLNPEQAVLSCNCSDNHTKLAYPSGCKAGVTGCTGKIYVTIGWLKNETTSLTS